ncbi:MAG TPA: glycosyltransferase [Candidatus Paceibacterota bacterium]|nr:glycosyltransferase [Candidatus Paceibacterota bacterium]
MRVLAIGSDRSIAIARSESARRHAAYGSRFGDLRIIVFSLESQRLATYALSVETHVYPTSSSWRGLYGWGAFWIALKLPKPDVVTVQDPFETGLIGWIIARVRGAAFHVQVHTDMFAPAFRRLSLANRCRVFLARFIVHRADRIRVVSKRIKDGIEKKYAPRAPITVLPIYTDVARLKDARAGALSGRFARYRWKFLVVARLEPEKDVTLALESFAEAAPQDACLIVVGDGRERHALEARATQLGVANRVFFEGTQDAAAYYAIADLVLVPSRFEGYGRVIVEALAAGKPVLATDVGVAGESGAIVSSRENFSDALRGWIDNGPREGTLAGYPYGSFDQYADAYATDIVASRAKHLA